MIIEAIQNFLGPYGPHLAWAVLAVAVLILLRTVYLLFIFPQAQYAFLLEYEDSRRFLPFVVAELYCAEYPRLPMEKLKQLLLFFLLGTAALISGVLLALSLLFHYDRLPFGQSLVLPVALIAPLSLFLLLLFWLLTERLRGRLRSYYQGTDFYRQSAISEAELRGSDGLAKGMRGEYYAWRLFQVLPAEKFIIISPLVPKPNGSFAEIDMVVLSRKGIFCVEAKNREGTFLTSHYTEGKSQWRYVQAADAKRKLRISNIENPLVQNQHHIWTLANFWHIDSKYFFNVLCFGNQADLKRAMPGQAQRLSGEGSLLYYGQRHKLYEQARQLPDRLGSALIERLYKELTQSCRMSRVRREAMLNERQSNWQKRKYHGRRQRRSTTAGNDGNSGGGSGGGKTAVARAGAGVNRAVASKSSAKSVSKSGNKRRK